HPVRAMAVHRSLQAVLMAGLIVVGSGHHATGGEAHAGHGLPVVLLLGVAAMVFAFASGAVALRRGLPPLPRAEAALGAASVALMALPLLAA
ncbi:dethiobiotin synthase domain protein, partial [Leifsonia aquatica ATCC 14665]